MELGFGHLLLLVVPSVAVVLGMEVAVTARYSAIVKEHGTKVRQLTTTSSSFYSSLDTNSGGQTTGLDEDILLLEPSGDDMNFETASFTPELLDKSDDQTPPLPLREFKSPKQLGTECPLQYNIEAMEGLQKFVDKHHNLTGWSSLSSRVPLKH